MVTNLLVLSLDADDQMFVPKTESHQLHQRSVANEEWRPGSFRSCMLLHIGAPKNSCPGHRLLFGCRIPVDRS